MLKAEIIMEQTNTYTWDLKAAKGHTIRANISLQNAEKALEYGKLFASSFIGWDVVVKPLIKDENELQGRSNL